MNRSECDILVVGAGILGAAAAYHLKQADAARDILLIDRSGVGQGSTSKSVSMVRDSFTSPHSFALASATIHEYKRLYGTGFRAIDLRRLMYLWLFTREQFERIGAAVKRMEEHGVDMEVLPAQRLAERAPCMVLSPADEESAAYGLPPIHAGLLCRNAYSVDPVGITQGYVDRFKDLGGRTAFGLEAEDFIRRPLQPLRYEDEEIPGQPFASQPQSVAGVVLSDGSRIAARTTVLAVGAWSRTLTDRLGQGSLLSPKKRQWFYLKGEALAALLNLPGFGNEDGTLPFTILPQGAYLKPSREGGFYVALADDLGRPFGLDTRAERDYFVNNIHPLLKGYFPQFANAGLEAMDAGLYCYDEVYRTPLVDWLHAGIMLVGGASGSGIMKADAIGRVAAHRYALGPSADCGREAPLELPGGFGIDTRCLTIRGRGCIEPEQFVI